MGADIDRWSLRGVTAEPSADGAWSRLARRVMAHPVAVLVPTLTLLLVLGLPFLHVRFNAPDATILPAHVPSRESYDILAREFGEGEFAPIVVALRTTGAADRPRERRRALRLVAASRRRTRGSRGSRATSTSIRG